MLAFLRLFLKFYFGGYAYTDEMRSILEVSSEQLRLFNLYQIIFKYMEK